MNVSVGELSLYGNAENLKNFLQMYRKHGLHNVETSSEVLERLQSARMPVHPESSIIEHEAVGADRTLSLEAFILSQGWLVPRNIEQGQNLYQVLITPLPRLTGNNHYLKLISWSFVLDVNDALRSEIETAVQDWISSRPGSDDTRGLLKHLIETLGDTEYGNSVIQQKIDRLLAGFEAEQLGVYLQTRFQNITFVESASEWCMVAILVNMHANGYIADYELLQSDNWGLPATTVIQNVETYLLATGHFEPPVATVAAYLMIAGIAPALTVYDLPGDLVFGSTAWALFNATALRLDLQTPGICAAMSFGQVMSVSVLRPITNEQALIDQQAWRSTLIQWGVMNGVIGIKSDAQYDAYIEQVRDIYNQQVWEQAESIISSSAVMPTRKALAEWELIGLFASDTYVNEQEPRYRESHGANVKLSLVEIYMRGWVPGKKITSNFANDPLSGYADRLDTLPRIGTLFSQAFTPYVENLRAGYMTMVKSLLSQLPLKDRRYLETGEITVYSLQCGFAHSAFENYAARVAQLTWRHGVLLRVAGGWGVEYYEIIPGAGIIKKNYDLPVEIETGYVRRGGSIGSSDINGYYGRGYTFNSSDYVYTLAHADEGHDSGPRYGIILEELEFDRADVVGAWTPIDSTATGDYTYSTRTTHYIAQIVARHLIGPEDALKKTAWGLSLQDEIDGEADKWIGSALAFIPFYTAIKNFIAGNTAMGLFYASLDVFGFMLSGTGNRLVSELVRSAAGKGTLKSLAALAQAPSLKRLERTSG